MKNILYTVPILLVLTLLFVLDKSLLANIFVTSYLSTSLIFLLFMSNNFELKSYWFENCILGLLVDSFFRQELGLSSLGLVIMLFINNLTRIRFKDNKLMLILIGIVQIVATLLIVNGLKIENIGIFIYTVIITFVISNYKLLRF